MSVSEPSVLSGIRPDGTYAYTAPADEELGRALMEQGPEWPPTPPADEGEEEDEFRRLRWGVDEDDLAEAGWGVVFPAGTDGRIRDALRPLLERREEEAEDLYKSPQHLTLNEKETWESFLQRHDADPAEIEPERMPYYLLLVGGPQQIPFEFQWGLDYGYAVGRLDLPDADAYRAYAESVLEIEDEASVPPRRVTFFGVRNVGDRATQRTSEDLIEPLAEWIEGDYPEWDVRRVVDGEATRGRLSRILGGEETPGLLFTASHGMVFEPGDSRQRGHQGALLCSDWPGRGHKVSREHYFAAEDLAPGARLRGTIAVHFACHSGGTPAWDSFPRDDETALRRRANKAFLSALPRALLAHPEGGALAVLGHIDRAWTSSFDWYGKGKRPTVFKSLLGALLDSKRIGFVTEVFATLYGSHARDFAGHWAGRDDLEARGRVAELGRSYRATNDARGFAVFGDPAVRLAFS